MSQMTLMRAPLIPIATGAALIVGAALFFQYVLNYPPCELCHYQRWPYFAIIALAVIAVATRQTAARWPVGLAAGLLALDAGIAVFHSGVERKWWKGPSGCSGFSLDGDPAALLEKLKAAPAVACDDIAWSFLGLSMANWNFLLALGLLGFTLKVWRQMGMTRRS